MIIHNKNKRAGTSQNMIRSIKIVASTKIIRRNNTAIAQSKARFQTYLCCRYQEGKGVKQTY